MIDLINGDCLLGLDNLIANKIKVDCIITDPPFNIVEKLGDKIHLFRQGEKQVQSSITKESMDFDIGFDQISWLNRIPKILKKGGQLIIFNDWENMGDIAKHLRELKLNVKSLNHWQKTNPMPAEWKRRFVSGREYFLYCTNGSPTHFNVNKPHNGAFRYPLTRLGEKEHGKHPNQKPLNLMSELLGIVTSQGNTVLDPFMGSGSMGVACKKAGRNFIGIELRKKFFDIASKRINEFTENPLKPIKNS